MVLRLLAFFVFDAFKACILAACRSKQCKRF